MAPVDPAGSLCYLLPVARHIDRKQLKKADQFVSFWTHVGAFVSAKRNLVLGVALGTLGLIFAVWGGAVYYGKRAAQTSQDFARIERIAAADLLPATGEAPAATDGLPHFKTEQERLDAALKEADAFLASHSGSRLKDEAQLLRGKYLLALGKPGDAASLYQALLAGSVDRRLRFLAEEGLGYALEASGQIDAALNAFVVLTEDADRVGGFYRDRALFHRARLLDRKGDRKEAGKLLHEILEKTPTTPLREEINDRLATLEGK